MAKKLTALVQKRDDGIGEYPQYDWGLGSLLDTALDEVAVTKDYFDEIIENTQHDIRDESIELNTI